LAVGADSQSGNLISNCSRLTHGPELLGIKTTKHILCQLIGTLKQTQGISL